MRGNWNAPLTLKEFVDFMLTVYTPCESVRDLWRFEGGWLASHALKGDSFPMEQCMASWREAYASWQETVVGVTA